MSEYRKKVLVNLLILIIGIILIFSVFLFFSVRHTMLVNAKENLTLSSESNAEKFNSKLRNIQNTTDNLLIVIEDIYEKSLSSPQKKAYTDLFDTGMEQIIYETGKKTPGLKSLYFYLNPDFFDLYHNISFAYLGTDNFERIRILSQDAYDSADPEMYWFYEPIERKEGVWIEPYYWETFKTNILTYSSPAITEASVFGVLGMDMAVEDLIEELEAFRIFESGNALLLNEVFHYIVSPLHEPGEYFFDSEAGKEFKEKDFKQQNNQADNGVIESSNYLLAYSRLSNGWIMAVKVQKAEVFKPMRDFLFYVVLMTALFITLSVFIAGKTAGMLSRPLEKIARNIKRFDINKQTEQVKTGITELDVISQNFKSMADSVSHSYEVIREKNVELEEAYGEVEKAYKEIEELAGNLEGIVNLTSSISFMAINNELEYLIQVLETIMTLLKDMDKGIILKYENHTWIPVYHIMYSEDDVQNVLEMLYSIDINNMKNQLEQRSRSIDSVSSPLIYGDKVLGAILVGKSEPSENTFSVDEKKILKAFSNLAASVFGIQQHLNSRAKFRESILLAMIKMVELHDSYTKGHSESVSKLSVEIAKEMGLSQKQISTIKWAGLVHDIGKILIPKEILNKPERLNPEEYKTIQKHPEYGAKALFEANEIGEVAKIVKYHHERWDGTGYPDHLKENSIPLGSRIVSVADTYDAMVSDRPYRKGLSPKIAEDEIIKYSGKQFDPEVVKAFLRTKHQV